MSFLENQPTRGIRDAPIIYPGFVNLKNHSHDFLLSKKVRDPQTSRKSDNGNGYLQFFANFMVEISTKKNETKESAITVKSRMSMVMDITLRNSVTAN